MNKSALRSFSAWARRYLISNICDRAQFIGVTKDNVVPMQAKSADSFMVNGVTFEFAPASRDHFVDYVKEVGWENAIEEIAYTWFNRILAIRFMEVNGYLENGVNGDNIYVIGSVDPDRIFPDAVDRATELKYVDKEKVYKYQDAEDNAGLFRYILMSQCAELSKWMPDVFEKVSDYTDLLLPETLLFPDGLIEHLTHDLNAADFDISAEGNGQVEIFGWMYQFYIAEKKQEVEKSKAKINKGTLPAKTQLFTPDWIVRYMVENTLGEIWTASRSESELKAFMKYYIEKELNDETVRKMLEALKRDYSAKSIREIKFLDPCCGSGHILVYAFDLFYRMYLEEGYTADMIPSIILENNLYGLDVDRRAIQLTSFALTMKARSYNKRLFKDGYHFPNVLDVQESNNISERDVDVLAKLLHLGESEKDILKECIYKFYNAELFGSLIDNFEFSSADYKDLYIKMYGMDGQVGFEDIVEVEIYARLYKRVCALVKQAEYMSAKYDCVVTNPPYLSISDCDASMKKFAEMFYPDSKTDTFAMFIERCLKYGLSSGMQSLITMHSWMFLSSYESLRSKLIRNMCVLNMIHLGPHAFEDIGGEVVQTTAFIVKNSYCEGSKGTYYRLVDEPSQQAKEAAFLNSKKRITTLQSNFEKIPGSPFAYWVSDRVLEIFEKESKMEAISEIVTGMSTGCNEKYLRFWFEPSTDRIAFYESNIGEIDFGIKHWIPYNKGGEVRKWYGNNDYVVKWSESSHFHRPRNTFAHLYLKKGLTWSFVTSGLFSIRFFPDGFLWDVAGCPCVIKDEDLLMYVAGYLNSNVANMFLKILNPTINCQVVDVQRTPIIISDERKTDVVELARKNIEISTTDWNSFETSWDFKKHPFLEKKEGRRIEDAYEEWQKLCNIRFEELKENEEELNRIFIDICGLQDELCPTVEEKNVTVHKADLSRDIRSFISYAVGCILGRYSLKKEGLIFAGGVWDESNYADEFYPCEYGVLPITEEQFFEEDLCTRVIDFIREVFGESSLNENLKFIASALNPESYDSPKKIIRDYLFNDFFDDHYQVYQHRPIYWQLDSGNAGGFRAIVYMHRFNENILPLVRTEFIQDLRYKYEEEMQRIKGRLEGASTTAEKNSIKKDINTLDKKIVECTAFDELLNHASGSIQNYVFDFDEGVKANYSKFLSVDGDKTKNILTVIKL